MVKRLLNEVYIQLDITVFIKNANCCLNIIKYVATILYNICIYVFKCISTLISTYLNTTIISAIT